MSDSRVIKWKENGALERPDSVPFMVSSQGGYKLLESEYPRDPMGRLKWGDTA